jgi:RNA polymerase sigma-70 factor (ECF subfamily)
MKAVNVEKKNGKAISEFNFSDKRDFVIIRKVLLGETEAFKYIFKKYKSKVYAKLLSYLKNKEDAEDITMLALTKVFENLNKYKADYTFNAWLTQVVRNTMLDFLREKKKNTCLNTNEIPELWSTYADDKTEAFKPTFQFKSEELNPEVSLIKKEENRKLRLAINSLSPLYKRIIIAIYIKGMSYEETAEYMGIPITSLKPYVFRAKGILREKFGVVPPKKKSKKTKNELMNEYAYVD